MCQNLQNAVKNAIETMTGLRVVEVNVFVQSVVFEKPAEPEKEKKEKKEKPPKEEKLPGAAARQITCVSPEGSSAGGV